MRRMIPRQLLRRRQWPTTVQHPVLLGPIARPSGQRGISTCAARYAKSKAKAKGGKVEEVDFASMSDKPDQPTLHSPDEVTAATSRKSKASKSPKPDGRRQGTQPYESMTKEESDQFDAAVASGEIPFTELSKVVFRNWIRFPGCTVLIKVGSFYEVSLSPDGVQQSSS